MTEVIVALKVREVRSTEKTFRETPSCNAVRIRPIPPYIGEPHPDWLAVRLEAAGLAPVEFLITTDSLALALLAGEGGGERGSRIEVALAFSDAAKAAEPGLEEGVARVLGSSRWLLPFAVELVRLIVVAGITARGCCTFAGMLYRDTSSVGLGRGGAWRPAFRRDGAQ